MNDIHQNSDTPQISCGRRSFLRFTAKCIASSILAACQLPPQGSPQHQSTPRPTSSVVPEPKQPTQQPSKDRVPSTQQLQEFLKGVTFNEKYNLYIVNEIVGGTGNYMLQKSALPIDPENPGIENETIHKLYTLTNLLKEKADAQEINKHLGVTIKAGTRLQLQNFNPNNKPNTPPEELDLQSDAIFEVNRIMFKPEINKILLGIAHSFTSTGHAPGDVSLVLDYEQAIKLIQEAYKASVLLVDVTYDQAEKHQNIKATYLNSARLYPKIVGEIDLVKFIGLDRKKEELAQPYVEGDVRIGNAIQRAKGGGACAGAVHLYTSMILGMKAHGVHYEELHKDEHHDPKIRYEPASNDQELMANKDRFDVTVFYNPDGSEATVIFRIQEGIELKMNIIELLFDPQPDPLGHMIYLIQTQTA
jgi:hypothetical protein